MRVGKARFDEAMREKLSGKWRLAGRNQVSYLRRDLSRGISGLVDLHGGMFYRCSEACRIDHDCLQIKTMCLDISPCGGGRNALELRSGRTDRGRRRAWNR